MSKDTLKILDCDSHVCEPQDLWEGEYMDPRFRGAAHYRLVDGVDEHGRPNTYLWEGGRLMIDNAALSGAAGIPLEKLQAGLLYREARGFDPKERLDHMDVGRIDHQHLNPSAMGLRLGLIENPVLADAMCRAYNDWVADHCEAGNGRLSANMCLPWQDPELAVKEIERSAQRSVFRGALVQPSPSYVSGWLGDPDFDQVYAALEANGLCLTVHSCDPWESYLSPLVHHYERARRKQPDQWGWLGPRVYWLIFGFPIEQWTAFAQLCFEGVFDRHPDLRVMLTESHGGWMVTCLERMDEYARGGEGLGVVIGKRARLLPSEYFARQCFVVFEGDEKTFAFAAEHIGEQIIWGADYPHADASFPETTDSFRANLQKVPEHLRTAIAWDNGARCLGM